jgi:hypothetical protein
MADKRYVGVAATVKDAFDKKYKGSLPKVIKAAVEKAVNSSSKLTTKPPVDKNTKGFFLATSLVSLDKDDKAKPATLEGQASIAVATWPDQSIFATAKGSAKTQVGNPNKLDDETAGLVEDLFDDLIKRQVIKVLENRPV